MTLKNNTSHYTPTLDKYRYNGGTKFIEALDSINLGKVANDEWLTRFCKASIIAYTFGEKEFANIKYVYTRITIELIFFGVDNYIPRFVGIYNLNDALEKLEFTEKDISKLKEKIKQINDDTLQPNYIISEIRNCALEFISTFSKDR